MNGQVTKKKLPNGAANFHMLFAALNCQISFAQVMPDLAGRGPLGPKPPKEACQTRKPIARKSAKKLAHEAAERALGGGDHMAKVKTLPCLVCGAYGVEVHHETKPRSSFKVLPLCPRHHRREFGPGAYHYAPQDFYDAHGSSAELLARVKAML